MRSIFVVLFAFGCSSPSTVTDSGVDSGSMMTPEAATDTGTGGMCSAVVTQLLEPFDSVSTRDVTILSDVSGVKTVYIDASAGGFMPTEPRVYVKLSTATRVDITDKQAPTSTEWDLALKRYVIFTNSGDAGPGMGGSLLVSKAFDQVTMADAMGKIAIEQFTDKDCNPIMDMLGGLTTTMGGWYNYDMQTMAVTPKPNVTFVVRSAAGVLFKLAIQSYYSTPDGGVSMSGAHYLVKLAAL
jgi:hypothetical protein